MTEKLTLKTAPIQRDGQEHLGGFGTGDYYCRACGEPMPIISKPNSCITCGSKTGHIEPEPTHGESWRCSDCGKNWGWVFGRSP
jgi:DNA-directed RNA polymerase subunit RPC12/RpoP